MTKGHSELEKVVKTLRSQRDELRLKLHLAKADARDQWAELEQNGKASKPGSRV